MVLLGLEELKFNALEKRGDLKYTVDRAGRKRFDPKVLGAVRDRHAKEVVAAAKKGLPGRKAGPPGGEICAKIFQLFGERLDLRQIVIETQTTPEDVLELRQLYADMGSDFLLSASAVREIRELIDWTGDDEKSLIKALNVRLRRQFERGQAVGLAEQTPHDGGSDALDDGATASGGSAGGGGAEPVFGAEGIEDPARGGLRNSG